MMTRLNRIVLALLAACLMASCSPPMATDGPSAGGFAYESGTLIEPRPNRVHIATVDLSGNDVRVHVIVAPDPDGDGRAEAVLMDPVKLVAQSDLAGQVLAFTNAGPWDAFPDANGQVNRKWFAGQHVYLHGYAVVGGVERSPLQFGAPVLWFDDSGRASISSDPQSDAAARNTHVVDAVAGFHWLLKDGKLTGPQDKSLHPRTAVGVNADGTKLVLIVVDGRHPGVSEGMNHGDLAAILLARGCTNGINLDGGGSSVFALADPNQPGGFRIANRPSDMLAGRPGPRPLPNVLAITRPPAGE